MEYEVMEYMEQVNVISEEYQKKSRKKSVRLSGLEKKDKLVPVITLVVYYGKEKWDGSGSCHKERYAHLNQSCIDVIEALTNTKLLSEYIN